MVFRRGYPGQRTVHTVILAAREFAKSELYSDRTGHDWWHVARVAALARKIALGEGADQFIVELTALLHDIRDVKFSGSRIAGAEAAFDFCHAAGLESDICHSIANDVHRISYRGAGVPDLPLSACGQCVRDADRLDAMGAIGIARAFAYGGAKDRPMHDPGRPIVLHKSQDEYLSAEGTTVNHFYEKLLLLRQCMLTSTGKRMAERRHDYMVEFLREFDSDWVVD